MRKCQEMSRVKNRIPCCASYYRVYFFQFITLPCWYNVDMKCISEAYLEVFYFQLLPGKKQSKNSWSLSGSFKNTHRIQFVEDCGGLDCPTYWRASCPLHSLPNNNSWFWMEKWHAVDMSQVLYDHNDHTELRTYSHRQIARSLPVIFLIFCCAHVMTHVQGHRFRDGFLGPPLPSGVTRCVPPSADPRTRRRRCIASRGFKACSTLESRFWLTGDRRRPDGRISPHRCEIVVPHHFGLDWNWEVGWKWGTGQHSKRHHLRHPKLGLDNWSALVFQAPSWWFKAFPSWFMTCKDVPKKTLVTLTQQCHWNDGR